MRPKVPRDKAASDASLAAAAASLSRFSTSVVVFALLIGFSLRIASFLQNRSLWMDESMFGLNIALFPARHLIPLPLFEQMAAPLFVWLERASVVTFGVNERALRLAPLLAGCALLPAMWVACRRSIGREAMLAALCCAAFMPMLVHYSAEAKPYAIDALVAIVLIGLAAGILNEPTAGWRWMTLCVAGMVGLMLSIPSILVLASIAFVLLASAQTRGARATALVLGVTWAATFALLYFTAYDAEPARSYNRHFWFAAFLGSEHSFSATIGMLGRAILDPFVAPVSWYWGAPLLATVAVGCVSLFRRARWIAVLITAPILLNVAASFARVFPFGGRVALFAAPLYCILFGAGLAALASVAAPRFRAYAVVGLTAVLMLRSAGDAVGDALDSHGRGESREVVRGLLRSTSSGQPIYLFVRSVPNWVMYSTDWSAPDTARAFALIRAVSVLGPNSGNAPARRRPVSATEGDDAVFAFRSSVEILGLPTGIENFERVPPPKLAPDSGWAEREVERMRAAGQSVWIFVSHARKIAEEPLLAAICAGGGRITRQMSRNEASLYYVAFSDDGAGCGR